MTETKKEIVKWVLYWIILIISIFLLAFILSFVVIEVAKQSPIVTKEHIIQKDNIINKIDVLKCEVNYSEILIYQKSRLCFEKWWDFFNPEDNWCYKKTTGICESSINDCYEVIYKFNY